MTMVEIRFSGFGGQGVIRCGLITGKALALYDDKYATMTQSFGPEARGSACSAQLVASVDRVLYPYIDVPGILPTAIILLILNTGRIMNVGFEKTFLLQNDLNLRTSEVIATYTYKVGLLNANFSFGTAIGLFNSVINLFLLVTMNQLMRKVSESSLW